MNGVGSRDPLKARSLGGSAPAALGVLAFVKSPERLRRLEILFFSLNQPRLKMTELTVYRENFRPQRSCTQFEIEHV